MKRGRLVGLLDRLLAFGRYIAEVALRHLGRTLDVLVGRFTKTARRECEKLLDRSFVTTSWKLTMDYFPPYSSRWSTLLPPAMVGPLSDRNYWLNLADIAIQFPYPPLISVTDCTYIDPGGTLRTLDVTPAAKKRASPRARKKKKAA